MSCHQTGRAFQLKSYRACIEMVLRNIFSNKLNDGIEKWFMRFVYDILAEVKAIRKKDKNSELQIWGIVDKIFLQILKEKRKLLH